MFVDQIRAGISSISRELEHHTQNKNNCFRQNTYIEGADLILTATALGFLNKIDFWILLPFAIDNI